MKEVVFAENFWKRKGLFYHASLQLSQAKDGKTLNKWTINKKLFFVSFWLIKWYYGDKKLIEMATTVSNWELFG